MSRVHVGIGYKSLSADNRVRLWQGFFAKLSKERSGKILIPKQAKKYVLESEEVRSMAMNGRGIRNALQTAISLAEFESLEQGEAGEPEEPVVVEESHFRRVLEMSAKFQRYVTDIRQEDLAKRALLRGDRWDYAD